MEAITLAGTAEAAAKADESDHPDYVLMALSDELDAAQAATDRVAIETRDCVPGSQDDKRFHDAYDRCRKIVNRIETTPARTLDGLRVKARAIEWCHVSNGEICLSESETTDIRLAHQIINALLRA